MDEVLINKSLLAKSFSQTQLSLLCAPIGRFLNVLNVSRIISFLKIQTRNELTEAITVSHIYGFA